MSRGVNKVIIIGNVGGDPESRTFDNGGTVTNISVATSESWKDKQTGQQQERTEWHRIVLRDMGNYKMGQLAIQWLRKGSKVYVEGSLRTRKYQAQDGSDRYVTEIIAEEFQVLDKREDGGQQQQQQSYQQQSQPAHQRQAPAQQQAPTGAFDDDLDDIPF